MFWPVTKTHIEIHYHIHSGVKFYSSLILVLVFYLVKKSFETIKYTQINSYQKLMCLRFVGLLSQPFANLRSSIF